MIVVAGEALVDLVIDPAGTVTAALGGAPFNTACAAARLGADVEFVGTLSEDRFGSLLQNRLAGDGAGTGHAPRSERPTTLAAAELDSSGAAEYRFYIEGTSAPHLTASDVESLPIAPVLFTGGLGLVLEPMAESIAGLVAGLPDATAVFVDVNCRPKVIRDREVYVERIERVLARSDVVKVSDEDLAYLRPGLDVGSAAECVLALGPAAVVVTHGATATVVVTAHGTREIPVRPLTAPLVDTIGAGDTFGAGLVTAWLTGGGERGDLRDPSAPDRLARSVAAAHAAVAVVVTRRGADPPWRHELADDWGT